MRLHICAIGQCLDQCNAVQIRRVWCGLSHLLEADLLSTLAEATAADVEVVLADQTDTGRAHTAAKTKWSVDRQIEQKLELRRRLARFSVAVCERLSGSGRMDALISNYNLPLAAALAAITGVGVHQGRHGS